MHLFNKYILGLRYCLAARDNSDPNSQGLNLTKFLFQWEGGRWRWPTQDRGPYLHIFPWLPYSVPQAYVTKLSFPCTPQTLLPCMAFPPKTIELKENRDLTKIKNMKLELGIWLDSTHYKPKLFQRESTFFSFFFRLFTWNLIGTPQNHWPLSETHMSHAGWR